MVGFEDPNFDDIGEDGIGDGDTEEDGAGDEVNTQITDKDIIMARNTKIKLLSIVGASTLIIAA